MMAFCLSTLYFWPASLEAEFIKYLVAMLIVGYFVYEISRLKHFQLSFTLHCDNRFKYSNDPADYLCRVLWVSPLFCAFYVLPADLSDNKKQKKRLIVIWRDMMVDESYRNFSRLLLFVRRG